MTELAPKLRRSLRSALCTPLNRLLNLVDPPVIVLLYHRVAELASDPELLAVSPDNFRAQMRYLKETFPLVRFEDDWGKLSHPAVAVTFDDGYADNALAALPILEEIGVPATFFVTTGPVAEQTRFWWHELERVVLGSGSFPPGVTLEVRGRKKSWPTAGDAQRLAFYRDLVEIMKDADAEERDSRLAQLRLFAGDEDRPCALHRAMTVDELRVLSRSELVTVGAHTVTHSRLAALSPEAQREEIAASKTKLQEWLDREVTTFSYPYGKRSDYGARSVALCREAGFAKAAANFPGQAHRWSDPYQIPRHLVRNWTVEVFAERLRGFWTR